MKTGLIEGYSGATKKIEIIDETVSGKYVVRRTIDVWDGKLKGYGAIELVSFDKVTGIKEE